MIMKRGKLQILFALAVVVFVAGFVLRSCHCERERYDATVGCITGIASDIVERTGFASPVYEAWGHAVCCGTNAAEGSIVIRSAGQDGLLDTPDDVVGNLELFGERNYLLSVRWECGFDGGGRLDAWHETRE